MLISADLNQTSIEFQAPQKTILGLTKVSRPMAMMAPQLAMQFCAFSTYSGYTIHQESTYLVQDMSHLSFHLNILLHNLCVALAVLQQLPLFSILTCTLFHPLSKSTNSFFKFWLQTSKSSPGHVLQSPGTPVLRAIVEKKCGDDSKITELHITGETNVPK